MNALPYTSTIVLEKEDFKFSAAHFTIFQDGTRERLHGHNFNLRARIDSSVARDDMGFNYGIAKSLLREYCRDLDEYLLLPERSRWLKVVTKGDIVLVELREEVLQFAASDVRLLPVENITVEALSRLFAERLTVELALHHGIRPTKVTCGVSSGSGQWGEFALTP